MASGKLQDYIALGDLADRPVSPDLVAGATGIYFAEDTSQTFMWSGVAWVEIGLDGDPGLDGAGVPAGGTAGQVLAKIDGTDDNTHWVDQSGGGGGGGGVDGWEDPNPLVAHRYWRILIDAAQGDTSFCYFSGLVFRDGATDLLSGVTYTASNGSDPTSVMIARDGSNYFGTGALPAWVKCDFGSAVLPTDVEITVRNGFQVQGPQSFTIQYSDDNATWFDALRQEYMAFASGGTHRMKLRPWILQLEFGSISSNGSYVTLNKLQVFDPTMASLTGPNIDVDNVARGMYIHRANDDRSSSVYMLDNGVTDNSFYGNTPALGFEFRFPTEPDLGYLSVGARASYGPQGPSEIRISKSRDGIIYRTYRRIGRLYWPVSGFKKVFPIQADAS